ncbi:hypothetical protein MPSEU_000821900 [Mayamaea pseudoterrestris]|nr:hypothetical protein MPSEU_000821900 [Mayamaea pseudoterrestris]
MSMPEGSPWCQGLPTMWFVGHQAINESPWCLQADGTWKMSETSVLDTINIFNAEIGKITMDRHGCTHMDINGDGLEDVICTVGAGQGKGIGYGEVYLTESNGALIKIMDKTLGNNKYPTMRNRIATTLRGPNDTKLLFVGVEGDVPRTDGKYNKHIMFRNDFKSMTSRPWFTEVQADTAPWKVISDAIAAIAVDITGNGVDDLILCHRPLPPAIYTQTLSGRWKMLKLSELSATARWSNVRVADVTGDGRLDLIAVNEDAQASTLLVFQGREKAPYFDFYTPWYQATLPFAAPDLEIIDVDNNGRPDIYVVQNQLDGTNYCFGEDANSQWGGTIQPDASWVPPVSKAQDILFVGRAPTDKPKKRFQQVTMQFKRYGCGGTAIRFGSDQRLILGNGNMGHPGFHSFLEWL